MLSKKEQTLIDSVNEERVVQLCRKLVSIPTVNPYSGDKNPSGEKEGLDYMEGVFKSMGAKVTHIPCDDGAFDKFQVLATKGRKNEGRHNVVAEFVFGNGNGPTVLMDAHMDTVAADSYDGNPFDPRLEDGYIYGRGTSDDKGGVAAMTEAVSVLLANPDGLNGRVLCCVVTEEECDGAGRGTISCIAHLPKPDAAILLDGDWGRLQDGCTGVITARVTVKGKSGHAAYGATNAIEQAIKLLPAFEAFRKLRGDLPGMFNFGVFQAGNHPANVPSQAVLAFNIKTTLDDMWAAMKTDGVDSGRKVRELFEHCINDVVSKEPSLRDLPPEIIWTKDMPATSSSKTSPEYFEFCRQAFADATSEEPVVGPLYGWGDLAHCLRAGIPTVGIGSGVRGLSHSANEKVSVAGLVSCAKVAALIVARKLG